LKAPRAAVRGTAALPVSTFSRIAAPETDVADAQPPTSDEVAPYVADAVEHYLEAYVEIAPRLGAEWIVMHAGFHFTSDKERRMAVGRDRLKRIASHAERHGTLVLLENLNKEPDEAEIHYLSHTVEEWRYYFDAIRSPAFKLSSTVNHAHLVPEGINGFVERSRHESGRRGAPCRSFS
jgi:sugar phosphate isomerase/epimerase